MRVDLPVTVTASKDVRGRIRNYTARLGAIEVASKTERGARDAMAAQLARVAVDVGLSQRMLWSLDGTELWITVYDGGAWYYHIVRRDGAQHHARDTRIGCWEERANAEDAMRAHWYQANVDPIVRGIRALVGWGDYECTACGATVYTRDPGRCPSPACGRESLVPWRGLLELRRGVA